jgi:hypothetical protein
MLKSIISLVSIVFALLLSSPAYGQVYSLSTDADIFIQELESRLTKAGSGDKAREAASAMSDLWRSGGLSDDEKSTFITHVNIMLSKKYIITRSVAEYSLAFSALKNTNSHVQIPSEQFFEVSMQAILNLGEDRLRTYLRNLFEYLPEGYVYKRGSFHWFAHQTTPRLLFLELGEKGTKNSYQAPIIRFTNTELNFKSDRDSTKIFNTSGDFNLLSRGFVGLGGTITWEKMGLPAGDVYVNLRAYRTNFNYGNIEADSAIFFYKSLLKEPLQGRFEDRNVGYKNINSANYPYFKSYTGGVVIENIVPDVRYEGGFSLKGIRKVGSSYNVMVDYVPPPMEEEEFIEGADDVDNSMDDVYMGYDLDQFGLEEGRGDEYYDDYNDDAASDDDYYDDLYAEDEGGEDPYEEEEVWEEESGFSEGPMQIQKHVPAKLEIKRGESYVMKLQSEEFVLDQERMVAKNVEASVYFSENDSLSHPAMDLLFLVEDREVILKKPKRNQLGRLPFRDSYHEFYLYFETIRWNLNSDQIEFTAFIDKENKLAAIESFSFFQKSRFDEQKGVLRFNPIGAIYRFAVMNPRQPIFIEKILEEYNLMEQQTAFKRSLPMMEGSGFIRYDRQSMEIFPQPKLFEWGQFVRGKKDYDAIQLVSKVDTGAHAVMNVEDKEMELRGCPYFSLSDSQYLRVVPINQKVKVRKDRVLEFGGALAAGKLNFYGSSDTSFVFNYESFRIEGRSLDSMKFVMVRNPPRDYVMSPLEKALRNTVFEDVSGAIHIDAPNNKSGKKDRFHFPVFDSYTNAYVYWDAPDIQDGVYEKSKLHFALDPFVLDSLGAFDEKNLLFDGEFFSSNIFPRFNQTLVVMEDFTLGFKEQSPPNGYYIYENKGLFYNEITLDRSGLHGAGKIEALDLDVTVESDSFVFHFDSVMAVVENFHRDRGFRSGSYYPEVDASIAQYTWYPQIDKVTMQSIGEPMKIFGGEGDFVGELTIQPDGMIGNGILTLGQVRVESDSIIFNEMDFKSPEATFVIIDEEDPELYHFLARNVQVDYDVYYHKSQFRSQGVDQRSLAFFPIHQYRTSLAKGEYERDRNTLKLEGLSAYIKDNYFVATAPERDSLKFNAKESYYRVDDRSIEVNGVPYIYVADATITPDKLEVVIEENGSIKRLENAVVEADQETKIHRIYEASIDIRSANDYGGSGKYDYINVKGEQQYILLNNIKVNSDTNTVASGGIPEVQSFYLTERIFFKGNTSLDASRRFLEFEGEVKIESENPAFKGTWFEFDRAIVNPDSVYIPIKKRITNERNELLTVGLNYSPEERYFYTNFLQPIRDEVDEEVISASGGLTFDRRTKEFRIGSREKLTGQSYKGSTVSFNDSLNTITSQGLLDFPDDFAKNTAEMRIAGAWKDDLRRRELETELLMAINFDVIPTEPFKKLSENLLYLTAGNVDVDYNRPRLLEHISELLDEGKADDKEVRKFANEVQNAMVTSDIKLARLIPSTLLLSDVNFNFSREHKALYSDSEIGLLGLAGETINKKVPAKIVYTFGRTGSGGEKLPDRLDVYLEIDEFNWVYFGYSGEVVWVTSSYYDDFNYPLQAEIDKRKKDDGFRFEMSTEEAVSQFKQNFIKKFIIN